MKHTILKDTLLMTVVDVTLQGATLLINVFLTKTIGEELLGIFSLVMSFYSTFVVISNGNSFLCANRFISEERGKVGGNPNVILGYSLAWSSILSVCSAMCIVMLSSHLSERFLHSTQYDTGIKVLAVSLVVTSMCSCIKGYFHAHRKVTTPLISGCVEFICRNLIMVLLIVSTDLNVMMVLAISVLASEIISVVYLMVCLSLNLRENPHDTTTSFKTYVRKSIPIAINSGIPLILSTCNDALLPLTLKQCGSSTEESFGLYGMFEAIVLQILFFPSAILCSLSSIIVTEVARSHSSNDMARVKSIAKRTIKKALALSVVVAVALYTFGDDIAILVGSTPLCGRVVKMLAPVVPFIYAEIILESILKGLGEHSFSSINYVAEYVIRIATLLICVPLFHFYGIVVSYYVSNVVGNISRAYKVYSLLADRPVWETSHAHEL